MAVQNNVQELEQAYAGLIAKLYTLDLREGRGCSLGIRPSKNFEGLVPRLARLGGSGLKVKFRGLKLFLGLR